MATAIVLGGGISGLSCAYYLRKFGRNIIKKVILVERSPCCGGWLKSTRLPDGTVFEHGPRSIRVTSSAGKNTLQMVEDLNLALEVLPVVSSHIAVKRRLIYAKKQLHVLPSTLNALFKKQEPFSRAAIWSLAKDIMRKPKVQEDESVHDFAVRRFGTEIAEYVMDPVCRGIVAGNSKKISVRSLLTMAYNAEQKHGSVVKGLIRKDTAPEDPSLKSTLNTISQRNRWSIWSFKTGLQTLPDQLTSTLGNDDGVKFYTNTACKKIHFTKDKAMVHAEQELWECDHIFSCLPARDLSGLFHPDLQELSKHLLSIPTVHVAVVNLEYEGNILAEQGFGYLVPSTEESKILGVIFDSCCFPQHSGQHSERTRLTVMMGGYWFESLFGDVHSVKEDTLLQCAIYSVAQQMKITSDPVRYHVSIQKDCIPQYYVGHHAIVDKVKKEIEEKNLKLSLLGSSYEGVSVNECIYNSRLAVEKYLGDVQN